MTEFNAGCCRPVPDGLESHLRGGGSKKFLDGGGGGAIWSTWLVCRLYLLHFDIEQDYISFQ